MALVEVGEPFPIYFEIWLPSVVHHLGFRVRPILDERFRIHGGGQMDDELTAARDRGVLILHPVKHYWD